MTIKELLDAVCRLGFQTEPEEEWEDSFYEAVNHALREIRRVLPEYASERILHYPVKPIRVTEQTLGKDGYTCTLSDAGAIELSLSGYADLTISSAAGQALTERIGCKKPAISRHRYLVSDLISNGESDDVTIQLTRSGACRVSIDYWETGDGELSAITTTEGNYTMYDLSALYGDFGALQKVLRDGRLNVDFKGAGRTILGLPTDDPGEYTVIYRKKVPKMDKEPNREIPLSDDEGDLIALLVASYVLLDEPDSKSAWYRQQYDNQIAALLRRRRPPREQLMKNVNNW